MRFTIVTFGSEGDTRPLAALSRGLLDAGHELKLFADKSTLGRARELSVPCEALEGDVKSVLPIVDPMQKLTARSSSSFCEFIFAPFCG